MHICVCVCVHIYVCIYACMCMYTYIYMHVYIFDIYIICIYMYTYVRVYIYIFVIYIYVHIHVCIYYVYVYITLSHICKEIQLTHIAPLPPLPPPYIHIVANSMPRICAKYQISSATHQISSAAYHFFCQEERAIVVVCPVKMEDIAIELTISCSTLQHAATHCNAL